MDSKTERIAALNDQLRRTLTSGTAFVTLGVAALGRETVERIVHTIAVFDDFCNANDPHQEHDFGAFEVDGHSITFKIEYYDSSLTIHSKDPSDPWSTQRVIYIMLASEY